MPSWSAGAISTGPSKWNGRLSNGLQVEVQAPLKKPADFKIIGQSLPRKDLPGKVFGTLEMVNDVRLPGMLHARMIRPTVAGAVPVKVDEASISAYPGRQGRVDQGPARGRRREGMERGQGGARAQGDLVGIEAEFPGPRKAVRAHPQGADRQARVPAPERKFRGRHQAGGPHHRRRLRIPDPVARQHGPGLRRRRCARRRSDDLDVDAEALRLGLLRRRTARPAEGEGARDLDVRHRLLRPQRAGRCDGRRRGAVEASRAAGARAIHAARGAGLGSERHGLDQPQPRRSRRQRQGDRLREHQQGVLAARQQHPRDPRRRRAGRANCSGCRSTGPRVSKSRSRPTRSSTAGSAGRPSRR